jgi:hypothetical protein
MTQSDRSAMTRLRSCWLKSDYPVMSGVTPTAGGLVFLGDMDGNLYAPDGYRESI